MVRLFALVRRFLRQETTKLITHVEIFGFSVSSYTDRRGSQKTNLLFVLLPVFVRHFPAPIYFWLLNVWLWITSSK
jgi:hypothetical protein